MRQADFRLANGVSNFIDEERSYGQRAGLPSEISYNAARHLTSRFPHQHQLGRHKKPRYEGRVSVRGMRNCCPLVASTSHRLACLKEFGSGYRELRQALEKVRGVRMPGAREVSSGVEK